MRWDEEYAISAFTDFLKNLGPVEPIVWEPVGKTHEAPDYYVMWRQPFAVEVTAIMDEELLVDGKPLTSAGVLGGLARFFEDLQSEAKRQGILRGTYQLCMEPVPRLADMRARIRDKIFDYLARTQELEQAGEVTIDLPPHREFSLRKLRKGKDVIYPVVIGGKSGAEIPGDLRRHLDAALSKKRWKLRGIAEPKVLLILDRYGFGDAQRWRSAVESISLGGFHTVARVWTEKTLQILASEEKTWLSQTI